MGPALPVTRRLIAQEGDVHTSSNLYQPGPALLPQRSFDQQRAEGSEGAKDDREMMIGEEEEEEEEEKTGILRCGRTALRRFKTEQKQQRTSTTSKASNNSSACRLHAAWCCVHTKRLHSPRFTRHALLATLHSPRYLWFIRVIRAGGGRGLSLLLHFMETVSTIHHGRNNHSFCFILHQTPSCWVQNILPTASE